MRRLALLPHVFVAGGHPAARPAAYVSGRALRAAIAANAALMPFAGDDKATRAPGGSDAFAAPAPDAFAPPGPDTFAAPAPGAAAAAPAPPPDVARDRAAPAQPRVSAPDRAA